MAEKIGTEEQFRESLTALVVLGQALKPYCETLDQAIQMASFALDNEGQAKLLLKLVTGKK